MDSREATEKFRWADDLFRAHEWARALGVLEELDAVYPNERKVLFPMARCLAELRRFDDAILICDRLIAEHNHDRAARLRARLLEHLGRPAACPMDVAEAPTKPKRFRIKPVRVFLLLSIAAAMWQEWMPIWLGGGLIAAYFLFGFALGFVVRRLFEIPFKMKAAALRGASAEVHSVQATEAPPPVELDDEDEEEGQKGERAYYLVEATITPRAPVPGQAFRGWEPGELAVADAKDRIRNLDDHDKTFGIHQLWFIEDGKAIEDEGMKVGGPCRLRFVVGVPNRVTHCKFVYYSECFGEFALTEALTSVR